MAYTTINKSSSFMNTVLYTGNSSARTISGVGFKPDFTWIKARDGTYWHQLTDIVRGYDKQIASNNSGTGGTSTTGITSWNSDGFALGTNTDFNNNTYTFAAWNWLAGGSQGSSNTDGSINTTYTSVNTTAGFSISSYTGTGANATVGHGLGAVPKMIIVKNTSTADSWMVYNVGSGSNAYLHLETTNAALSPSTDQFQATTPTSSFFYVGTANGTNKSSSNMIAYCFAEKQGYSKFGSYVGNGNSDGPMIYTGFKPAWVMAKKSSATGGWQLRDNKRTPAGNLTNNLLYANATSVEQTTDGIDILSNGFKLRNSAGDSNASGATYIYMAFGQSLVGTNNIPNNAF